MDEEKNIFEQEPAEDTVAAEEDAAEEVAAEEVVAEEVAAEEVVAEEVAAEEVVEETENATSEVFDGEVVEEVKASSAKNPVVLAVVITALVMVVLAFTCYKFMLNQYNLNCKYSITIAQAAEEMDMTLEEFKTENGLPDNMRGDTYYAVAQNYIPFTKLAEQNGLTAEEFIEQLKMYYPLTDDDLASVDINKATIGDMDKLITDATKRAEEATPDPAATPEPVSQEEAEAVARAILGDAVVDGNVGEDATTEDAAKVE